VAGSVFSPDRAFVVQVLNGRAGAQSLAGRVEHLASGEASHFASIEDLRAFLLSEHGQPRPVEGSHVV
jgi:hypothetical protein